MKKVFILLLFIISNLTFSQTWERFTTENSDLPFNSINNLLFDANDNLWINAYSSVYMYNNEKQEWINFNKSNSIIGEKINSLFKDNFNNIWAAGEAIYKFDSQKKNWELFDSTINADYVAVDDNGIIYIVSNFSIFYKSEEKWFRIFNGWKDDGPVYPSKLLIDKNNTLWFGFSANSFDFYSFKNNILVNYSDSKYNLHPFNTRDLCVDSNNNVWVVSDENAITYKYIADKDKWVQFDSTNSPLGRAYLYSKNIANSKDDKIWLVPGKLFSLAPRFLTYYKNGEWKKFSIDEAFNLKSKEELYLYTLAIDSKNNVWIGTDKGLIKFNEAVTTVSTFEENNIKLYPNPTNDVLYIDLSDKHVLSYSITDITGKILKQNFHNFTKQITIDTKSLTTGIYFINLKLSDNHTVQSKFVKV